ncbi:MAG: site-specific DNA-methyltransferase [Promethearchaeota archaeon]
MNKLNLKKQFLKLFDFDSFDLSFGIKKILDFKKQSLENFFKDLIIPPKIDSAIIFQYLLKFFSSYYYLGLFDNIKSNNIKNQDIPYWINWDQYYITTIVISNDSEKKLAQDYFIHKDLKGFLEKELNSFIRNELLDFENIEDLEPEFFLNQFLVAKQFKEITLKVIKLLYRIENFQLTLWKKNPIIFSTDYVITLDKIVEYGGIDFLKENEELILTCKQQMNEWHELFKINIKDTDRLISATGSFIDRFKTLPLDTKYFENDFKWKLLRNLTRENDLDEILDGSIIKGDNFQALNLLMKKFGKKVNLIYIDPPFSTGSDEYLYKNDYLNTSWLIMIYNRLVQAKEILNIFGTIFVRIDNNKSHYTRFLLDMVFGVSNFRNEIVINKTRAKQQRKKPFIQQTESLFFYSVSDRYYFTQIELPRKEPKWYELLDFPRANQTARTVLGKKYFPPKKRRWGLSQERIKQFERKGKVRINKDKSYIDCFGNKINGKPELYYDVEPVRSDWLDLPGYSQVHKFSTENSEELLQRVIESGSKEKGIILDYFLGSGTTIATAHKLNRKWIGIEIGDQFDDFVLPRMKKVLKGEKSGISKTIDPKTSGFFKYQYLAQFEDSIENSLISISNDLLNSRYYEIKDPFQTEFKLVKENNINLVNIDLIESFNYFLGLIVEKIDYIENDRRIYIIFKGKIDKAKIAVVWRSVIDLDFEIDKKIIEENLNLAELDSLFVNGSCLVKNAKLIERELNNLI